MNKIRLFIENFLVYGLGGIISKIIPVIMIPIVTRLMPSTEYFGVSDLSNTVISFASAFAIMGMYDAIFRMFFEKEDIEYKKDICSTALLFTLGTSFIAFIVLLLLKKQIATVIFGNREYVNIVYISAIATLVGSTNTIISAPTRMQNKKRVYLITNAIGSLLSYAIAIPMLINGYYTIALPLAAVISGGTLELTFWILNSEWFSPKRFNIKYLKQLLIIAVPLLPTFFLYLIVDSCDKVMITNIIGIEAAGVYSVASKVGSCSHLIYTAFAGGWQFFAFYTMKEKNQVENNSRIYEYLGVISFISTAAICVFCHLLFRSVFPEEYLKGYIIAPYLFIAPLLLMLYQIGSNQFLVIKKTWPGMFILLSGAITNVALNLLLIPRLGIEGAAIATLCGYITACIIDIIVLKKCNLMTPRIQFLYAVIAMIVFFVVWRLYAFCNFILGSALFVFYMLFCIFIYRKDIIFFFNTYRKRIKKE